MSEPQLERSVLEAKEREELFAIANALGTRPTSRARKSELVTQILQATGVEVPAPEADRPRRSTRARKSAGPEARLPLEESTQAVTAPGPAPARAARAARADTGVGASAAPATGAPPAGAPPAGAPPAGATARSGASAAAVPAAAQAPLPAVHNGKSGAAQTASASDHPGADHPGADHPGAETPSAADHPAGDQGDDQQSHYDGEPGNRRSRRRRGRDRGDHPQRDLAGQSPEQPFSGEPVPVSGMLDLREEGYGFLRTTGSVPGPTDVYVSISQVRRFALRRGDVIEGASRPAGGNEKYPALVRVDRIGGINPEQARARPRFERLTPAFPDERLRLELDGDPDNLTPRIIDLLAPIGKGQRGLIVSPPKAGKTTVLKQIAQSIETNNADVVLMVLLVDERPEEVTDIRRSVKGEVVASTFDRPAEEHTQVAELTIERAKRMVELGRDVVVILDGITRLARAYNLAAPGTGRIMSGGMDTGALYPPKKFFGAARNLEEGGSLTILATALVETGSRMDEVIFEEFKGTGNMELKLDRHLAERRTYPAIDVNASSTRHEELLYPEEQLQQVWRLRRGLNALVAGGNNATGLELLLDRLRASRSNDELLADLTKNPIPGE